MIQVIGAGSSNRSGNCQSINIISLQLLFTRIKNNLTTAITKQSNQFQLELDKLSQDYVTLQLENKRLVTQIGYLNEEIEKDKKYLHDLIYNHQKNHKIEKLVSDWDTTKFLPDKVLDQNPFSKDDKQEQKQNTQEYSGAMVELTDLYHFMANFVRKENGGEANLDWRAFGVIETFQNEMNSKFKNVQNATALKTLKRFYKKLKTKDQETHMDISPDELERQKLLKLIDNLKDKKEDDAKEIMLLKKRIEDMGKQISKLFMELAMARQLFDRSFDKFNEQEVEIREKRNEFKRLSEQLLQYQLLATEVKQRSDDLEVRFSTLKLKYAEADKSSTVNQQLAESLGQERFMLQLQNKSNQLLIAELQEKLKSSEQRERQLKLVKKPVYSEKGERLGVGYVEQYVTINTDQSQQDEAVIIKTLTEENFESEELDSEFSFDEQEKDEFHQFIAKKTLVKVEVEEQVKEIVQKKVGYWAQNISSKQTIKEIQHLAKMTEDFTAIIKDRRAQKAIETKLKTQESSEGPQQIRIQRSRKNSEITAESQPAKPIQKSKIKQPKPIQEEANEQLSSPKQESSEFIQEGFDKKVVADAMQQVNINSSNFKRSNTLVKGPELSNPYVNIQQEEAKAQPIPSRQKKLSFESNTQSSWNENESPFMSRQRTRIAYQSKYGSAINQTTMISVLQKESVPTQTDESIPIIPTPQTQADFTQTEDFMFPLENDLKRQLYGLIPQYPQP